ncbi:MAG: hypothetical protein ACK5LC_08665 [Coprobacillaceae bacterium]
MREYSKKDFYNCVDEISGERKYFIRIKGQRIKVKKEVYNVFINAYKKELRDIKRNSNGKLVSYDQIFENGLSLLDLIGKEDNNTEILYQEELINNVKEVIEKLSEYDKKLITQLLFHNIKEKELAKKYNIRQQNINKRKKKIIEEIKNNLSKKGVK